MSTHTAQTGYAPVNGLQLYYEIHGAGQPLILLHGSFGVVGMFTALLPALAKTHQVIAVELQAHGHTGDIDRPLSFESMADDIAGLIGYLGLGRADILGYSLGGGVALQTAIRHPEVVRKLVIISAVYKSDGWFPESRVGMASITAEVAATWVGSPMHEAYASVAPQPADWPKLGGKLGQLLGQDYDWGAEVATMPAPALIVIGDADGVRPAHAVELFGLLGGGQRDGFQGGRPPSQLAVLPDTNHLTILERADLLLPMIPAFLDTPDEPMSRDGGNTL